MFELDYAYFKGMLPDKQKKYSSCSEDAGCNCRRLLLKSDLSTRWGYMRVLGCVLHFMTLPPRWEQFPVTGSPPLFDATGPVAV